MFTLQANRIDFYEMPYKYDLSPEDDPNKEFEVSVALNNKHIEIPGFWNNRTFVENIIKKLGSRNPEFSQAEIHFPNCNSASVVNEVFDSIV